MILWTKKIREKHRKGLPALIVKASDLLPFINLSYPDDSWAADNQRTVGLGRRPTHAKQADHQASAKVDAYYADLRADEHLTIQDATGGAQHLIFHCQVRFRDFYVLTLLAFIHALGSYGDMLYLPARCHIA